MDIITYSVLFLSLYFEVFLLVSFLEKRAYRKAVVKANAARDESPSAQAKGDANCMPRGGQP
jgi:hypothetical protein